MRFPVSPHACQYLGKLDLTKIKNFRASKDTDSHSSTVKRKKKTQLKMGNVLNKHFSKGKIQRPLGTWKDAHIINHSVQFSRSVVSDSLRPLDSQHARPPCPSPTPRVHSNSPPSSQWCHPAISSSVVPFSSCPESLPGSGSFPMSQLFAWGGQNIRVSASASVFPMNTQDWSPSEWTGWTSLQSKGLSRVFSNTTVQKHQFFGAQPSS